MRSLIWVLLAICALTSTAQAAGVHHTLFQEDWGRTPAQLKEESLTCLYGPAEQCRADRHIAASPKERIERYAREGFGMEVDEFLLALDGATIRDCVGTIRTMFVDDEGNFVFRTRPCKVGPNGEPEQIAVLPDGNNLALPCANPNEKEVKAEVPPSPAPEPGAPEQEEGCIWKEKIVTYSDSNISTAYVGVGGSSVASGFGVPMGTSKTIIQQGCER